MIKTLIILIILPILQYTIFCARPQCTERCCKDGREYQDKEIANKRCVFGCYLKDAKHTLCKIYESCDSDLCDSGLSDDMIFRFVSKNNYTVSLKDCLRLCPPIPSNRICVGNCCEQLKRIEDHKSKNPRACCEDSKRSSLEDVMKKDPISCRTSSQECPERGFMFLFDDSSSACVDIKTKDKDVGYEFGFRGECGLLKE
nr:CC chemokine family protein [Oriental turtle dovepox virus]